MKPARLIVSSFVAATAAIAAFGLAIAQGPGPIADPKSENQTGFPAKLYSWVIPPNNPQTPAKIALGKALFFEDALSADGKISCDHCHSPAKGFTDQLPTSMGIHAQFGQRNAPSVLNALFNVTQILGRPLADARSANRRTGDQSGRDGL
jgi:cytochrome c peroxidase